MHELSIVMGIVDLAQETVEKHGASSVESINLEIGELAGIDWPALKFAWTSATRNTVLANAECNIIKVEGEAECTACHSKFHMKTLYDQCPHCSEYFAEITSGKELRIKSIVVN